MIDLHAHILPGLDDGPADLDEALDMCRVAAGDGVQAVLATPHTGNGFYLNNRDRIIAEVHKLNEELKVRQINIQIFPGTDTHINFHMAEMLANGNAMTVNDGGRYLMVEIPHQIIPPGFDNWIFGMKLKGIIPIVTHPERNLVVEQYPDLAHRWIELGALIQVTAMSITGEFGSAAEKTARYLLSMNLVHVIATDAHSAVRRPPVLSRARDVAAAVVGEVYASQLVHAYPLLILEGKTLDIPPPIKKSKRLVNRFNRS